MSVTARGGYQIIDLKEGVFNIANPSYIDVSGSYEQAVNALNKPAVINHLNINVEGNIIENPPFYVSTMQAPDGTIQLVALMGANQVMEVKIKPTDTVRVSVQMIN